jgi:hypothetical protein
MTTHICLVLDRSGSMQAVHAQHEPKIFFQRSSFFRAPQVLTRHRVTMKIAKRTQWR